MRVLRVVFFGMLGVTVFGLLLTPLFYVVIRAWVEHSTGTLVAARTEVAK
ncbi:MAG: hypothetical protein ACRDF6_12170 [bacterium]